MNKYLSHRFPQAILPPPLPLYQSLLHAMYHIAAVCTRASRTHGRIYKQTKIKTRNDDEGMEKMKKKNKKNEIVTKNENSIAVSPLVRIFPKHYVRICGLRTTACALSFRHTFPFWCVRRTVHLFVCIKYIHSTDFFLAGTLSTSLLSSIHFPQCK